MSIRSIILFLKGMFGIHGRASRSQFWLTVLFLAVLSFPSAAIFAVIDTAIFSKVVKYHGNISPLVYFFLATYVASLTPVTVRRLHDVNRSGKMVVFPALTISGAHIILGMDAVIPYLTNGDLPGVYALITLFSLVPALIAFFYTFIRGTVGPNSYGPDPLQKSDHDGKNLHNSSLKSINIDTSHHRSDKTPTIISFAILLSITLSFFLYVFYYDERKNIANLPKFDQYTPGKTEPTDADSFYQLCKSGTADQIKQAIRGGINVNRRDAEGGTCLIWAAAFNQKEAIKAILDAGADPLATDESGFTALVLTTTNRNPDVIALLTEAETKARRDAGNNTLQSPSKELIDGNVKIFRSLHHPKAHGLDFSMKYPESFHQKEDDRQDVIQRIMDKKNKHIVVIEVSHLPRDISKNDIYNLLKEEDNPEDFKEFINIEGSYMHYIGGIPARIYYGTSNQKTSFGKIEGALTVLFTVHNNNVIMINFFHIGMEQSQENKSLASIMINSIVFHN